MSYPFKATRQLGGISVLVYTASPAQMEENVLDFFMFAVFGQLLLTALTCPSRLN